MKKSKIKTKPKAFHNQFFQTFHNQEKVLSVSHSFINLHCLHKVSGLFTIAL